MILLPFTRTDLNFTEDQMLSQSEEFTGDIFSPGFRKGSGPISAAQPFCYLMAQEGGREGQVLEWLEVTLTGTFLIFEVEPWTS